MTFAQYADNERNTFQMSDQFTVFNILWSKKTKGMGVGLQQHIDKNDLLDAGSKYPPKKEKAPEKYLWSLSILVPRDRILIASGNRMRQRRTSGRHGDFQVKLLKSQKYRIFNQLILFQFFS